VAANFLAWARPWLTVRLQAGRLGQETRFQQVKTLVRLATNSPAVLEQVAGHLWVCFSPPAASPAWGSA
jgi:hypothetical protein